MGVDHTYRYVNATNVYNKGKADGGACTLLWTNPKPTEIFNAQTISINLTNYDAILLQIKETKSYAPWNSYDGLNNIILYLPKTYSAGKVRVGMDTYNNNWVTAERYITSITNSGIVFGNQTTYGQTSATDNNRGIPLKIWGLKCAGIPVTPV